MPSMMELPDLAGLDERAVVETLRTLGLYALFIEDASIVKEASNVFVNYEGHAIGDSVKRGELLTIRLSKDVSPFFRFRHLPYEGPRLPSEAFSSPWKRMTPEGLYGTSGAFTVTYAPEKRRGFPIDGDTTVFWYPQDVFDTIPSPMKSVRYFLIDAPETFAGGEEKWGLVATEYVDRRLREAESIALQTDKKDRLFDAYGRLLAWVWVRYPGHEGYQLLNEMLVRQGLADIAFTFGAGEGKKTVCRGRTYLAWLRKAEKKAKAEGLGMHGTRQDPYWDDKMDAPSDSWALRDIPDRK